jgi:hypothetical protein
VIRASGGTLRLVNDRYRCTACGNLTRFDITVTRRTREYHHFSVGGALEIEDRELLAERVEEIECRWCGASGAAIEVLPVEAPAGVEGP